MSEQHRAGSLRAAQASAADTSGYPGQDLRLPETGPGSISGMGRRLGALFVDWTICSLVIVIFVRPSHLTAEGLTLALFAAQDILFTAFTGLTVGKLAFRIRVVRLDGHMVGPLWAFVRTLMLLLIAPPLIADDDMRGLQDRASNTVVVRI